MSPLIRGIIFDLDGTLVDSRLDFERMRREIGLAGGQPILEHVEKLPTGAERDRCRAIIEAHELEGARVAEVMPGVLECLAAMGVLGLRAAILTRNDRHPTALTLERLGLSRHFRPVLTREDAPPKPDPRGLLDICGSWGCAPESVLFVGDFRFDLEAGRRAGMKTALYAPTELPSFADQADYVIRCFRQFSASLGAVLGRELGFTLAAGPGDYYLDGGGRMVFTAAYHLKRGYCCGSGCRHCPYEGA